MVDVQVPGFRKYWTQKLTSLKSECHAIRNRYSEAASVVQQVYKVLCDIENLAGCSRLKWGTALSGPVDYCEQREGEQSKHL
jgi:hypothetical protein